MTERHTSLEVLQKVHQFPGPYVFKVIGENTPNFLAQVIQVVVLVLGPKSSPEVSTRQSKGGRHQSITLTARVQGAEKVLDIYESLRALTGVKFLL